METVSGKEPVSKSRSLEKAVGEALRDTLKTCYGKLENMGNSLYWQKVWH